MIVVYTVGLLLSFTSPCLESVTFRQHGLCLRTRRPVICWRMELAAPAGGIFLFSQTGSVVNFGQKTTRAGMEQSP